MSSQCLIGCKCNSNSRNFDPHMQVRPNLGSIELDYNVEMPTNFIQGLDGKSAYEYAVKGGYKCSEFQFYKDLAGVGGIEAPELKLIAESIKIGEDITVYTGDSSKTIGGYKDGDVIPANATLLDVLKGIFKSVVEYIYTDPVIEYHIRPTNRTFTDDVTPLIGDPIYLVLTVSFTRGDAGFVNLVKVDTNSVTVFTETDNLNALNRVGSTDINQVDKIKASQSFNVTVANGLIYTGNDEFTVRSEYNQGAIHNNSDGVESPGRITAGAFSQSLRINSVYPILYRYSDGYFDDTDLINNLADPLIYHRISYNSAKFNIPAGIKSIAIAIPKYKDPTESESERLVDVNFDNLNFGSDTMAVFRMIDSINGHGITYMGMEYRVYYTDDSVFADPLSNPDTCRLTLSFS